jgi:hypothetical protein
MGGSYELARTLADTVGPDALLLWGRPDPDAILSPTRNLPAAEWFLFDNLDALLPAEPDQALVEDYAATFPDHSVFVVTAADALPAGLDPAAYRRVTRIDRSLTMWDEQIEWLPTEPESFDASVTVWAVDPDAAQRGA